MQFTAMSSLFVDEYKG